MGIIDNPKYLNAGRIFTVLSLAYSAHAICMTDAQAAALEQVYAGVDAVKRAHPAEVDIAILQWLHGPVKDYIQLFGVDATAVIEVAWRTELGKPTWIKVARSLTPMR